MKIDMVDEYQTLAHHLLFDKLQNSFGRIEDSAKSMKRSALHFPATNEWILQELYTLKKRVDGLITSFETLEKLILNPCVKTLTPPPPPSPVPARY